MKINDNPPAIPMIHIKVFVYIMNNIDNPSYQDSIYCTHT